MLKRGVISFIGGGNMTRNLAKGLLKKGYPSESIMISNRGQEKQARLVSELGVQAASSNAEAALRADVIVLSVKPHLVKDVCQDIAPIIAEKSKTPLILSLAGVIRVEDISTWLKIDNLGIARVMTNIAIGIGMGTTAMFASPTLSPEQKKMTETLFDAVGRSFWVKQEEELNTLTPLIGCGPAYLYLLVEALQKAALEQGISASLAAEMAMSVISGANEMIIKSGRPVDELRESVTTPNGITAAAMKPLIDNNYFGLFDQSYKAGLKRCEEIETLSRKH